MPRTTPKQEKPDRAHDGGKEEDDAFSGWSLPGLPTGDKLRAFGAANKAIVHGYGIVYIAGDGEHHDSDTGPVWRFPILATGEKVEVLGQVGEVIVDAHCFEVLSATPHDEVSKKAMALAREHGEEIPVW